MRWAAIMLAGLLSGCGLLGDSGTTPVKLRTDANAYRRELNDIAEQGNDIAATAQVACAYRDAVRALRVPCAGFRDVYRLYALAWDAAWQSVEVYEDGLIGADLILRGVASVRRGLRRAEDVADKLKEVMGDGMDTDDSAGAGDAQRGDEGLRDPLASEGGAEPAAGVGPPLPEP